jgi:hypothetical protein
MNMNRNTKKGSLSLEATIFVPIFVIAILTVGYLIKVIISQGCIMHIMADEGRKLSMYSYNIKSAQGFEATLISRILEENSDVGQARVETFRYLYGHSGKEDLIGVRVGGTLKIKLPIVFWDSVDVSETLFFRAFTGREFIPEELDYSGMEEEDSRIVWVFPRAGERYHEEGCGYIRVAARQGILSPLISGSYKPCTLCGAREISSGSVIYYFPGSGEVYHKGSCFIVDRYVISMEEEDAKVKGYTPCSRCI